MLMTSDKELTALAARLLQAVQAGDLEGVTRLQIAADLGRPRNKLNPYDVELLEELVKDGYLTAFERKLGVVKTERVYRAKSEG